MSDYDGRSLEVDAATVHQAARDIRSAQDEVNQHLATVRGAAEMLGTAWTGQAAVAFTNLINRWNNDARQLAQAMTDIADLLDRSANRHTLTDADSVSMLNRMDGAIDGILHPHP